MLKHAKTSSDTLQSYCSLALPSDFKALLIWMFPSLLCDILIVSAEMVKALCIILMTLSIFHKLDKLILRESVFFYSCKSFYYSYTW